MSDQQIQPRRIDLDAIAPAVGSSRLAHAMGSFWSRLRNARQDSHVARAALAVNALFGRMDVVARIAFIGCLVTAAMVVHILLVLFAEPYPFPSRAALIKPVILSVLGLASVVMRRTLAAAWQDRHRSR